jgi:subtilase family serine protease
MTKKPTYTAASARWLFVVTLFLISCVLASASSVIAHNTPSYVSTAKNLGAADPAQTMEVSIWLNLHNRSQFDALAQSLYDRTSPNYRHWLSRQDRAKRFMPTAAEAKKVQKFFEANNLKVVRVGPDNLFVRARGAAGDVEKAFHVQLNNYNVLGKTLRANDRDPSVDSAVAGLVASVAGLDNGQYEHPALQRPTIGVKGSAAAIPGVNPQDSLFSNVCFPGTETDVFSNNGDGSFPVATYKGNYLFLQNLTSNGCAYTPPMVQTAYNLNGLYTEGYTGQGQTIGIIDWCGSLTIQDDANAFSAYFGLPALDSSNFAITYIPTASNCEAADQVEINIDVEWAHAIAPGANINLIVPPSATFLDVDDAEYTAITYGLANVISGSYGSVESFTPASILATENLINEIGAVSGVSTNFSSGDSGDFTFDFIPATVSAPADSPWATAVGGVTLALHSDNSIAWQAGWGNNEVLIAEQGFVADPPSEENFGFIGGAGGGPSNCASQDVYGNCLAGFPKPSYQKKLAGKYRQMPDISWLADPFTGVAIVISIPGDVPPQTWQVWGGTSVACPMFSALWAIANEEAEAGGAPALGLASEYVYSLPTGAVTDVVPVSTKTNVTASIVDSGGTTAYNASEVAGGATPAKYVSALWDYAWYQETGLVLTFGTDCNTFTDYSSFETPCNSTSALHTKKGWDNVTGVGTPNGQAFADSFYGK